MISLRATDLNSYPVTRVVAILGLAVALTLSLYGGAHAARPSHATVCNSPLDIGETSCGTGQLESTFQCRQAQGRYLCDVTFTLTVTVFGPACAEATSTWNTPVDACALLSSASNFTVATEEHDVPPEGAHFRGTAHICMWAVRVGDPNCESWSHEFFIPGDPSASADDAAVAAKIVVETPSIVIENAPPELRTAAKDVVQE